MRITDVTVELVELPAQPPFRWRAGLPGSEPAVVGGILRVHTDEGLLGEAHTRRGVIVADLVDRRIRADLIGRDPLMRELLWQRLWELDRIEELPIYALGLVDVALWDLAGKAAGLPVHRLLGGYREAIPAYASTVTFDTVEEYLDVADQCLELGYVGIKLHAWGDAKADADLCQKLRAHVGDDIPLMYDGSAGFDLADSVYLGRAIAEAGYLWYEEPMREFSVTSYKWLAEQVDIPLLVAETSDGAHMNAGDFIAAGTAGRVRTSAQLKGGITGAMRIAHLADSYQLRAEVHGSGVVNAHLCMAIPNTTYYESLVYTNPVVREPSVGSDGLVKAPTATGIGFGQEGW
ncbi:mandelate racemase family protein [Kitasatospora paracochleata]|uniref:L-alanine-DL-glutamate epimerase-like enolase superfamily enzyme n=1 Tax=Kitasatospora paracochleata TaxID=58354 RepID=A0ABT1IW73_9ACTN|nr:enolase C-terminal domain-like protein [Kitasatospora paracochleata]MCP2309395.1 L-alanine-DL-glutamate epimerase-like enolase superfamily enzyme [Kitasatospora paracochleata]